MIRAIILDDEHNSVETLQWKIENFCPQVKVVETFNDPIKGLEWLRGNEVDLVFLDIEMPNLSGFDVLEAIARIRQSALLARAARAEVHGLTRLLAGQEAIESARRVLKAADTFAPKLNEVIRRLAGLDLFHPHRVAEIDR